MARESLPPGFRFHPTDEELVGYYLKRKVLTKPFQFEAIAELDLYKFAPWDLPEKSCLRSRDLEWFFFCPRDKKYTNGGRTNRATEIGYWKTTGKDRPVLNNSRIVGMKKTLVFHLGRAPRGDRTDWVMHEYRLEDDKLADAGVTQDAYVLCRIFQKSGPGPKNGEQYGAPFREEDWDEELVDGSSVLFPVANDIPVLPGQVIDQTIDISKKEPKSLLQQDPLPSDISGVEEHYSPKNSPSKYDDIQSLLLQLSDLDDDIFPSIENDNNEKTQDGSTVGHIANPDGYDIYNGLEDITSGAELERINKFVLPNNPEGGSLMDQMLNGIEVGSYLELNDLSLPMEAGASEIEIFSNIENPMDIRSRLIPLSGEIMPTPARDNFCPAIEGSNSFMYQPVAYGVPEQINWEYQADIQALDVSSDTKKEKAGNECIRVVLACGLHSCPMLTSEQHNESSNFRHISSDGSSFSKLQSFLGSIPASPASAAEYPFSVKEGASMQKVSSYGSCVRFTAAVSVTHVCTKDSLLDRPVDFSCTCYGCKALVEGTARKSGQGASSSAFVFVFLLSVISALMWVFLLAIGAKLGRYAWKLLLP